MTLSDRQYVWHGARPPHSGMGIRKPDKIFIENYESIVPDIVELANYNIGLQEASWR